MEIFKLKLENLQIKNEEIQKEKNKLNNFIHSILQTLKQFFHKVLKIGTEKDKDNVVEYYKKDLYDNIDLHDIANNTSKEQKINDYLYSNEYDYDDKDFDI